MTGVLSKGFAKKAISDVEVYSQPPEPYVYGLYSKQEAGINALQKAKLPKDIDEYAQYLQQRLNKEIKQKEFNIHAVRQELYNARHHGKISNDDYRTLSQYYAQVASTYLDALVGDSVHEMLHPEGKSKIPHVQSDFDKSAKTEEAYHELLHRLQSLGFQKSDIKEVELGHGLAYMHVPKLDLVIWNSETIRVHKPLILNSDTKRVKQATTTRDMPVKELRKTRILPEPLDHEFTELLIGNPFADFVGNLTKFTFTRKEFEESLKEAENKQYQSDDELMKYITDDVHITSKCLKKMLSDLRNMNPDLVDRLERDYPEEMEFINMSIRFRNDMASGHENQNIWRNQQTLQEVIEGADGTLGAKEYMKQAFYANIVLQKVLVGYIAGQEADYHDVLDDDYFDIDEFDDHETPSSFISGEELRQPFESSMAAYYSDKVSDSIMHPNTLMLSEGEVIYNRSSIVNAQAAERLLRLNEMALEEGYIETLPRFDAIAFGLLQATADLVDERKGVEDGKLRQDEKNIMKFPSFSYEGKVVVNSPKKEPAAISV